MSTKQYLTDVATRHQVFLQRYAKGQSREAAKMLVRLRNEILSRLAMEPTEFQHARLQAVLFDIDQLSKKAFNDISDILLDGAKKLAMVESSFSVELFNRATTVAANFTLPTDPLLIAAVVSSSMPVTQGVGVTIGDALAKFGTAKAKQIAQMISDGVTLGDTTQTIARNVGDIVKTLHRRQLNALSTTIVNHSASIARNVVYDANTDIIEGYQWVATLDNKTTLICGSRDGTVYQLGMGPVPPAHWNCRSTTVPKIKAKYDIGSKLTGERPAIGPGGAELVSSQLGYGGWLKQQPVEFINEALGVERSKLFRSGKFTIDKFVDPTGRVYTIDELEGINPIAFL